VCRSHDFVATPTTSNFSRPSLSLQQQQQRAALRNNSNWDGANVFRVNANGDVVPFSFGHPMDASGDNPWNNRNAAFATELTRIAQLYHQNNHNQNDVEQQQHESESLSRASENSSGAELHVAAGGSTEEEQREESTTTTEGRDVEANAAVGRSGNN
jgi:hypothetical protein